ncbi:putative NADH dehydrogenase [Penaeus vannamei]|uniref:NADH dehydrogenase [ubiquinone] 1 beta subcomplex subunit 11, mitochondrial n=1 Tax=Penaeus vannamei TaxID=6689 RepID=A0A423TNB6_PENVA|nr:putative NADH dehydrogenase [Penaeus vannamei]
MAVLVQLSVLLGVALCMRFTLSLSAVTPRQPGSTLMAAIRKGDTETVLAHLEAGASPATRDQAAFLPLQNWISWGFSYESETKDNTVMHMTFFCSVTLCLVFGGFIWAYMPDYRMVDWAQREGYLELRRREAEGLPLIDPNLVSVDKFELPEDEELGDTEIII